MTHLYNCRHSGDEYRITKFDEHMNPVEGSSYLLTATECTCPAGEKPMCRHREMLPRFIMRGAVNTEWCYDYGRGGWVQTDLGIDGHAIAESAPKAVPDVPPRDVRTSMEEYVAPIIEQEAKILEGVMRPLAPANRR